MRCASSTAPVFWLPWMMSLTSLAFSGQLHKAWSIRSTYHHTQQMSQHTRQLTPQRTCRCAHPGASMCTPA
jgi:hypothetical protein